MRFLALAIVFGTLPACFNEDEATLPCTELRPGANVDVAVGGSASSHVELIGLMEFAGVAATTSLQLTAICSQVASELGTPQNAIDVALSANNQDVRMTDACKLAADALGRGHEPIALSTVTCTPAPKLSSCATPACDAAAAAKADCPEPQGVALHFAPILASRARLALMAANANALSASIDSIDDIKAICIPYARDRVRNANEHVAASQKAIDALVAAAGP